ncbi:efflux RND transporter periplasmic adaptor subunit [Bradyrhizobium sp.]|jgi:RND family efflux transporter MFP subunit|uniref:efflux RND transporter periplasmic adaptor subunit n=1 Tax=Bradyrhizobium sp. TaxID=376 RepID=UPI003C1672B5
MKNVFASAGRVLLTLVSLIVAIAVGWQLWSYYMLEPWTRDGRVRADVVTVAPDVAGLISDVFVHDNEKVTKGQPLFRIDQRRFQYALDQAKADVASRQATLDQAKRDLERAKNLTSVAITVQQVEQRQQAVDVDQAGLDAANAALEVASLNLERSTVVAPVNGVVTNFELLPGRYVNAGAAVFALLGSDTFRVEGYFEETKLRRIHIADDATVKLIGDPRLLSGHVESIAYGIEDQNRSTSSNLLASVNPTFSWVRLAQRIPVRIKLDNVPPDLLLAAGRTATVSIGKINW